MPPNDRRDFLHEVVSLVASAVALGALPRSALGLTVRPTAALRSDDDEAVYPIPAQDAATIDRERAVIVVRYQSLVYAFALWCPHQRTALRWDDAERRFRCPKHKSTFQPDGAFLSGRATRAMDRYGLRRDGENVVVNLSAVLREDTDAERWRQAVVQL